MCPRAFSDYLPVLLETGLCGGREAPAAAPGPLLLWFCFGTGGCLLDIGFLLGDRRSTGRTPCIGLPQTKTETAVAVSVKILVRPSALFRQNRRCEAYASARFIADSRPSRPDSMSKVTAWPSSS